MKKILFIFNGPTKTDGRVGVSGGEVRLFEIIKNTPKDKICILTTTNGDELIKSWKLPYIEKYIIDYSVDTGIKSNLIISLKSFFNLPRDLRNYKGSVYSSCEHLYDILPALRLKLFNKCHWDAVYHWVEDYPWKEKRGNTPFLNRYLYWLNRWFAGILIKYFADRILAVSDQTKDKLIKIKKVKEEKIKAVYCGVNYQNILDVVSKYKDEREKIYDVIYMKRLSYGKGILDLMEIWKIVHEHKNNAKLAIMGDGPSEVVGKIKDFIKKHSLESTIDLLGPIYDFEEKFRVLNSSKILVSPSYEENWAISMGEGMATGMVVIAYNLKEIHPIWKDNVEWVEVGDKDDFAQKILFYLNNNEERLNLGKKAQDFVKKYDWKEITKEEFSE